MKHLIQTINKRAVWLLALAIVLVIAAFAFKSNKINREDEMLPVALKAIKTSNGWGYEIAVDGKTFIHQECIPAIQGKEGFKNKEDALLVGRSAVAKIQQGHLPTITVEELKQLHIVE